jgi:membrane-bound lytic murein transglycosylase A
MNRQKRFGVYTIVLTILFAHLGADAKSSRKKKRSKGKVTSSTSGGSCGAHTVRATTYYLPKESQFKSKEAFDAAVKMQGSAMLNNGDLRNYDPKKKRFYTTKASKDCSTTKTSASGSCLLSYFSVAADPSYHRMGDVIYVDSLKGTPVKLPGSGMVVEHPGYFVVHDTGGAIKGPNRFDFFAGTDNPIKKENQFQAAGLADKNACKHKFAKYSGKSAEAKKGLEMIMALTDSVKKDPANVIANTGDTTR